MRTILMLLALTAVAHADSVEVYLSVVPPTGKAAPQLEATVIGAPSLPLDKLTLATGTTSIAASKQRSYAQGNEPVAIVFVVNGQEVWMGNDDIEKDEVTRYAGALKGIAAAIPKSKLAAVGPKGSKAEVVTYSTGAKLRLPMTDLGKLTGAAFGTQKDYRNQLGSDLVAGIELALADLHAASVPRRVMIVIGDGNDTNNEAAKPRLAALKKQAAQDGVKVFAIVYKGQLSDPGSVISTLAPAATTVSSQEAFASALAAIAGRIADRYYVTFPGYDPKSHQALPWDGKPHDLVLHLDRDAADAVTVTLAPVWTAPTP